MLKGDIVLILFPYTDLLGSKLRPALVLAESHPDVTVAFITTQLQWLEHTDILLQPDIGNGIKKPSLIRTSKISTLKKTLIRGKMGSITKIQLSEVSEKLKIIFQIK